jgi:hypothetical protein
MGSGTSMSAATATAVTAAAASKRISGDATDRESSGKGHDPMDSKFLHNRFPFKLRSPLRPPPRQDGMPKEPEGASLTVDM